MARDPGYERDDDDDFWRERYDDMVASAPPLTMAKVGVKQKKVLTEEEKLREVNGDLSSRVKFQEAEIARLNSLNGSYYREIQRLTAGDGALAVIKKKVDELGRIAIQAADPPEYRDGWVSGLRQAQDEVLKELGTSASGKRIIDTLEETIRRIERQSKTNS